jgi:hypothetical protein
MHDGLDDVIIAESDDEKRRAIVGDEQAASVRHSLFRVDKWKN